MASITPNNFSRDQQHPQWAKDRQITNQLLQADSSDYNLAELARLSIRYAGFPGGRDIQTDLAKVLQRWGLTEAQLFAKTRQIHAQGSIYNVRTGKRDDWT